MDENTARIKRNIQKMIDLGAPEAEIDSYVAGEGTSPEALRTPAAPQGLADRQDPMRQEPMPEQSFMERTGDRLRFGAQAVGEGLASVAGFPMDAATAVVANPLIWAKNQVFGGDTPIITEPYGGSESLKKTFVRPAAEALGGAVDPEKLGWMDRVAFEGTGAATGGIAGGLGMLARGIKRGSQIAADKLAGEKFVPKMLDSAAKTYADAPVASVVRDGIAGYGSGFGLASAKELPESVRGAGGGTGGVVSDVFASLLGGAGAVGAQNVGTLAARQGRDAVGSLPGIGKYLDWNKEDNTPGLVDPNGDRTKPSKRSVDMAAEVYQGAAVRPTEVAPRMAENRADLEPVLGTRLPSPGAMAEDPGVVRLERQIAMENPGPTIVREQDFNAGVRDVVDGIAPDGDPVKLQAAAQAEAARLRAETQAANDAAISEREARVSTVEGRQERVGTIRQNDVNELPVPQYPDTPADAKARSSTSLDNAIVDQTYIPDRVSKNALYDQVDPNRTEMVDVEPLADAAARVRQQVNELGPQRDQLPAEFIQRIERLAADIQQRPSSILGPDGQPIMREVNEGGPGEAAVGDIVDLQKYTGKARNDAQSAGNFALADAVGDLRKGANQAIENSPAAAAANRNYQENYAPKYRDGGAMEDLTRKVDRNERPDPSQTALKLTQTPESIASTRRVLDDSPARPQGNAAAREYLYADMAEKGMVDPKSGVIRPDRLRNWLARNSTKLDVAPGMREEVEKVLARAQKGEKVSDGLAQQIKDAKVKLKETERAAGRSEADTNDRINKGALGAVIDADPDKAVQAVMSNSLNSRTKMKELADLTKNDQEARDGLKASVRDYLIDKSTTTATEKLPPGDRRGPLSPAKTRQVFQEHEKVLAEILDPEEMNAMRVVQKALDLQKTEQVRVTSGSDTTEKLTGSFFNQFRDSVYGKAAEAVIRLKLGMLKGGGLISTMGRYLNNLTPEDGKQAMALLNRAALDPDLAMILATRKIPPGSPKYANTVQRALAGAAGARTAVEGDDEERKPLEVDVKKRP